MCAVDMPLLDADLIDELAGPAVRLGADVVLPWDGRDHYLAGIYRTSLADRVVELVAAGERSMRALVDSVDTQRIVMAEQRSLTNVNTAADLSCRTAATNRLANLPNKCSFNLTLCAPEITHMNFPSKLDD